MYKNKYSYRIFKASWGVAIDISSEITSYSNYALKNNCSKISDGLWYIILDKALDHEEKIYIENAFNLISKNIVLKSLYIMDTLIIFKEIYYNPCDYQKEGLIVAVIEWAKSTFDIEIPNYKVDFNTITRKYEFKF